MKKIVFLSTMAFDSNVSIIKRLKEKYDLYTFFLCNTALECLDKITLDKHIVSVKEESKFNPLASFLDFDKCFLVKHYPPTSLNRYVVAWKVYKRIAQINPDIIITDAQTFQYFLSRLIYRKRTISIVHDPFPHSGENTFTKRLIKGIQKHLSTKFLLLNETQKEEFIKKQGIPSHKVYTSFLSEYEFYHIFDNYSVTRKNNHFHLLFFGRISPYKGISYLLEACSRLLDEGKSIEVTVAGKGTFDFDIKKYSQYKKIHIINEMIESQQMVNLIKDCDAVICPYTDATQSGVIMTSYAFDKPVIATKVGGLPEMLNDGKTGYLIEPRNSESIYHAIMELMEHKNRLDLYQTNIHEIYRKGAKNWDISINKIISCIED